MHGAPVSSRFIHKDLGAIWKNYSQKEREVYKMLAHEEKRKTQVKIKAVEKSLGKKLKKPVCAYSIYMQ